MSLAFAIIIMTPAGIAQPTHEEAPFAPEKWSQWDQTTFTRYRDLDDTENELRVLSNTYPSICHLYNLSEMFKRSDGSPRLTVQGRTMWAIKISDNPAVNESSEPDALVIGTTHAREWIANEVVMFSINYILRNYGYNTSINSIVNETEMWFIPVLNPDGFQHSIDNDDFNNSYGVYGWRKNANESNGIAGFQDYGSAQGDGVDLNRNLGYKWGGTGSSGSPNDPTYRGTVTYSETENQILHLFARGRDFTMALSYHSYSGLNLYPWGYTYNGPEDSKLLQTIAQKMSSYNGYTAQQGSALYPTSGDFTDYFYGTYRIPAFTVELNHRNARFIPEVEKIYEDTHLNIEVTLLMARLARDPFSIFQSGLNATIVDVLGDPVTNASVNVTGNGRSHIFTANGSFNLSIPDGGYKVNITAPGGLFNVTDISVQKDRYRHETFVLKEIVPPVIEKVEAFSKGIKVVSAEEGSPLRIVVTEGFSETGLSGSITITGPDLDLRLPLTGLNGSYEAIWETEGAEAFQNYTVESVLIDPCGNMDDDGSVPGPDLTISLIDTTPPMIDSLTARLNGVAFDRFERGDIIAFELDVPMETIPVQAYLELDGRTLPLTWMSGSIYQTSVDSVDMDLGAHNFSASVTDQFGNAAVSDGSDLILVDTIPPRFTARLTGPSPFRDGDLVEVLVTPIDENLSLLRPEADIVLQDEVLTTITDHGSEGSSFLIVWDTTGVRTGNYDIEVRLYDDAGNFDPEGFIIGYDLSLRLNDLTPPDIVNISVGSVPVTAGVSIVVYGSTNITLTGSSLDMGSTCAIDWIESGSMMGTLVMGRSADSTFEAVFGAVEPGYGTYMLEFVLSDQSGNIDSDGFGPGMDLVISVERPPVAIGVPVMFDLSTHESWTSGRTGYVLSGEALRLVCPCTNMTMEDRFTILVDGLPSSIVAALVNGSITAELNTTSYVGIKQFTLSINLFNGTLLEAPPISAFIGIERRAPPTDLRLLGYQRLPDGSYLLNLTVSLPSNLYALAVNVNGSDILIFGTSGLFQLTVGNNVTISVRALYKPFPEGGRNLTFESAQVTLKFLVEEEKRPPESPPDDEVERSGLNAYLLILGGIIVLAVLVGVMIFLNRRRDVMSWEE
jgi:hypothetical protein